MLIFFFFSNSDYQHTSSNRVDYGDPFTSRREHQLKVIENKLKSKLNEMAQLCQQSVSGTGESQEHFRGLVSKDASRIRLQSPRSLLKMMKQVQKTLQSNDLHWQ